ncbi:hypothetical protein AOCH_002248 [Aspergillus ochraceoroseus]|uniref:Uncharacterized protein n=1 Tax=Aspergillus ochraceoroseus TaxID=138278 RepID=A0A0F8U4U6_9EURO|nr:hypothetical protein AOCH_002248 [Aspergillus ochraceoroseus]
MIPETFHLAQYHIKYVAAAAAAVTTVCVWIIATILQRRKIWGQSTPGKKNSSQGSKFQKPPRKYGEWIPSDFQRPPASPFPDWDVHKTKPIPYRPFRYGPKYFVTMGLRSMKWDEWIELDNHYLRYHADKAQRIQERGDKCCKTGPEAWDAAIELLEELYATYLQRDIHRRREPY